MDEDNKDGKVLTFLKKENNDRDNQVIASVDTGNPFGPHKYFFSLNSGFSCEKEGYLLMFSSYAAITDERGIVQFVVPWVSLRYLEKVVMKEGV